MEKGRFSQGEEMEKMPDSDLGQSATAKQMTVPLPVLVPCPFCLPRMTSYQSGHLQI